MHIANSEWKIMNLLWERPMTVTQLTEALEKDTAWNKCTIIALLKRLEERGCISYEQRKRTKWFFPIVDKSDASFDATEDFLDRTFGGSCFELISNMMSKNALSEDEVQKIRQIIDKV